MVTQILGEVTKGADLDKSRGFGGLDGSFLFFGDGFEKKPLQAMFLRNLASSRSKVVPRLRFRDSLPTPALHRSAAGLPPGSGAG